MIRDMAKSGKSNRMKMKGYPTHRFLRYKLSHTNSDGSNRADDNHYIDLARDLSAMNKRMYKQGRLYGVSSFTLHDNQSHIGATIAGLRHVWPTYSAYRMARRLWNRQNKVGGIPKGAWQQFIVALSRDAVSDADSPLPLDTEDFSVKRGEWPLSCLSFDQVEGDESSAGIVMTGATNLNSLDQLPSASTDNMQGASSATHGPMYVRNIADGTAVSMQAGSYSGSISACHEYEKVRPDVGATPEIDPAMDDSIFSQLLNSFASVSGGDPDHADDILTRINEEGDHPPYAQDVFGLDDSGTNDGLWVYREARFASGQKTIMLPGAEIPLGLLKVVTNGAGNGTCYLDIEIAPGGYKGVHALEV